MQMSNQGQLEVARSALKQCDELEQASKKAESLQGELSDAKTALQDSDQRCSELEEEIKKLSEQLSQMRQENIALKVGTTSCFLLPTDRYTGRYAGFRRHRSQGAYYAVRPTHRLRCC